MLAISCAVQEPPIASADETETESGDGSLAADRPVEASEEGALAIGSFRKPEGWEVKLWAAEPELANPVAMYVDDSGRVFVCESFRQDRGVTDNRGHDNEWLLADLASQSVQDRIDYHLRLLGSEAAEYTAHDDRIRRLEDTDGDGVADRATVFADGFNRLEEGTGAGVLVRGDDVYFTCIPKLWLMRDRDDDGVADSREALQDGYGVRVAFRGHDSHGLIIGHDGRLYFSIGDRGYNIQTEDGQLKNTESGAVFRCELDGSNLEVFATGLRNPQELAFDDYGYLFTGDNNSDSGDKARWVNVMEGGDTGWRMMYQYLPDRGPFNREKIWHPFSEETPAYIVPPIENISDGPSGLSCYPGTGLTGDFANCFFLVDFRGGASNSGIRLIRTQPKGAFWEVERSEQPIWNILATDAQFGPDGALWVCDWVNGWVGEGKGRIYRFFDPKAQKQEVVREVKALLGAGFTELPQTRLNELLSHLDRRIRLEAQWELAHRGEIAGMLALLQDSAAGTLPRLHATWGLGHAARLTPELVDQVTPAIRVALSDTDLDVRAAAANVAGDLQLRALSAQIVEHIADTEPRVQYAACLASGKLGLASAIASVCDMLENNQDRDPGLRHAGIMALAGLPQAQDIVALAKHSSRSVRLAAVVALRKRNAPEIRAFLGDADIGVVTEAVRGIHDVEELHELLPYIAALELGPSSPSPLVHRVLNANFRLGGADAAAQVLQYAVGKTHLLDMRVEAVKMLAAWGTPGKLDRVMNRFAPLEDRDDSEAATELENAFTELLAGPAKLRDAVLEAAVTLKLENVAARLRDLVVDRENPDKLRRLALIGFVALNQQESEVLLKRLITDKTPLVRAEAVKQLAGIAPEKATGALEKGIQSEVAIERQMAWDTLASVELPEANALIEQGLEDYLKGNLPPDVWLNVLEASKDRVGESLSDALSQFAKAQTEAQPLEEYRAVLAGGDRERGELLFMTKTELSCVRCHRVGEVGGEVGPELTKTAATKDARYLLEAIVSPDAKIAENFETVVLLMDDDSVVSGILRSETDEELVLMDAEGKSISVDPAEVIARKKGQSSMPADLVKKMSLRELRDLLAYLNSLK